jgi:hypothetical protein
MNMEQERVAFLLVVMPMLGNAYYPADTGFCDGEFYDPNMQRLFTVWLKAKEHAVEMAKPTVKIKTKSHTMDTSYPFVVALFEGSRFDGALEDFRTEDDAVQWALTNGYRVIE